MLSRGRSSRARSSGPSSRAGLRGHGPRGYGPRGPVLAGTVFAVAVFAGTVVAGAGPGQLRGGPLVLRYHGRGVDDGRGVADRPGGQRLVGPAGRRVPVGHLPPGRVLRQVRLVSLVRLVRRRGLGADDQLDVGPELFAPDLDDVVGLLAQRAGDGPVAVHGEMHQGDPHAEVLDIGDDLGQVLLRADHQGVADRVVARQRGQVPVDLGVHALAAAGPDLRHPELDPRDVGQRVLLGGAAAVDGGLVPVAAQQRQPGPFPGHTGQQVEEPFVVPGDRFAAPGPVHGHGTIREHVAGVNKQRAAIHGPTSFAGTDPDLRV